MLPQQHLCDTHGAEPTQETRHDRLRPRPASHGAATTLVRGFCAGRALCHSEPHHDIGRVRRVSDRERRYPSRALRCRILPRPRHAEPARAWFPDADPYRAGQRTVSLYGGGIAGRVSRTVEPVPQTRVRRRHDLSRARADGAGAWPHHGRGGIAQHRVQSAPRAGAGRTAEVSHSPAYRSAVIGADGTPNSHDRARIDRQTPTTIRTIIASVGLTGVCASGRNERSFMATYSMGTRAAAEMVRIAQGAQWTPS